MTQYQVNDKITFHYVCDHIYEFHSFAAIPINNIYAKEILVTVSDPVCTESSYDAVDSSFLKLFVSRIFFSIEKNETLDSVVSSIAFHSINEPENDYKLKIAPPDYSYEETTLSLKIQSTINYSYPVEVTINDHVIPKKEGVICAILILIGLYTLIIWEIVNRTFAAVLASTVAIGALAAFDSRPTLQTIISWIDMETILLLFGMMIIVGVLCDTGFFDYLAVLCYKVSTLLYISKDRFKFFIISPAAN